VIGHIAIIVVTVWLSLSLLLAAFVAHDVWRRS